MFTKPSNNIHYKINRNRLKLSILAKQIQLIQSKQRNQKELFPFVLYSDEMENEIYNGEKLWIDQDARYLNAKDIFLFRSEHEDFFVSRCKILNYNSIELIFQNSNCHNKIFPLENIHVIGKVVKVG